jgi:uncharacterized protein (TIGR04255 family)
MGNIIYSKSPIREAVFDVGLRFEKIPNLELLDEICNSLVDEYPTRTPLQNFQTSVQFAPEAEMPTVDSIHTQLGYRLTSLDGTKVLLLKIDGFTFSQLKPYKNWEVFSEEAKRLFDVYIKKSQPHYAHRLALRYINVIEIPETVFQLEEYFLTAPHVSSELPQTLLGFFSRLLIQDDKSDSVAIINHTTEPSESAEFTKVIFDIDVFQEQKRIEDITSIEFWATIEQLKEFRSKIFEGSITEKIRNLIA